MYRYHDEQNVQSGAVAFAAGQYDYSSAPPSGVPTTYQYLATVSPSLVLPGNITTVDPKDNQQPETQSYSLTVSQRLPWASTAEFSYVGNKADHLANWNNNLGGLNLIPAGTLFANQSIFGSAGSINNNPNINALRPYANYGGIKQIDHREYSNYNSFQASWNKQSGHLNWLVNYTFSKALGIRGEGGNGGVGDPVNIKNDYGVLANDRTHIFNIAYSYNLPSPIQGSAVLKGLVNGWQLSGISQFQSGVPLQDLTGNSNFNLSGNIPIGATLPNGIDVGGLPLSSSIITGSPDVSVQPVLTCDPRKGLASHQYANGACFTAPTPGHNGSFVFPYIKGPAFENNDLSMFKNFVFSESRKLQLRFSAYNFLNHPLTTFNPANGNQTLNLNLNAAGQNTNKQFGYADYLTGSRSIQLALKFFF